MAQWLNSPEAAWAFLYLGDAVRCDGTMGRSPVFEDSGCCIFSNSGQKGVSALQAVERDLAMHFNTADCIRSGQSVAGWETQLDETLEAGLASALE